MDIKRLMDEADARTVAEFLGMQIVKKGKYDFIQCPGHEKRLGKPDSHIGNAVLLKNGYKCFVYYFHCFSSIQVAPSFFLQVIEIS